MDNYCPWEPAQYLFFSENIPPVLYYSHFSTVTIALILIVLLLGQSKKKAETILLILLLSLFSIWSIADVVIWATNRFDIVMFWWSIIVFVEPLIFCLAFYLLSTFTYKKLPGTPTNIFFLTFFLPILLLLPTPLNLEAINTYDCTVAEGLLASIYTYFIEIICILGIIILTVYSWFKTPNKEEAKKQTFFSLGLLAFLVSFASGNIIGSITNDWELAQYGLFGMPVFAILLTYMIVKFRIFNVKLIGAQALVISLWILVGSMLFVAVSDTTRIVAGLTLIITSVAGYFLVRSVKKEVMLREELQVLTENLEKANVRLKQLDKQKSEFVSIASHQLRSPLTSIRGYASLLLEESFGKMPKKALEPLERIAQSSKLMALAIEDYLNVSRIESGNMKYNKADFNLRDEIEHVCDDLRSDALKRGLVLIFRTDLNSRGIINADLGKTVQIVQNLIHNSIKYTEKGTVKVLVRDDIRKKKIYVDIVDTGIGMSTETMQTIFQKFERAANANTVNTSGTGLGLFVALKMAEAMGGTITAHSEGDGKGSRFTFEMPLAM